MSPQRSNKVPPGPASGDSPRVRRAIDRLEHYPALASAFPAAKLRQRSRKTDARYWHPLLGPDSPCLNRLLHRLDLRLKRLRDLEAKRKVTNVEERRKHLREAQEIDDFNAARDEIFYASELSRHFRVDFNQRAGPDITVQFSDGQAANVEFTAMLTSQSFHRLMAQVADVQLESDPTRSYLVRVSYSDETEVVPEEHREAVAVALKAHLESFPGPHNARLNRNVAQGIASEISITLIPVKPGMGRVDSQQAAAFGIRPSDLWDDVMDRVERKSQNKGQFPDTGTNILVMDLVLAQPLAYLYFGQPDMWNIFEGEFDMSRFPNNMEAIVLTWTDVCGSGWLGARVIANPAAGSSWVETRNGSRLLRHLVRPVFQRPQVKSATGIMR